MHNAHVKKWIRWQHFWAQREYRQFAMLIWAQEYRKECGEVVDNAAIIGSARSSRNAGVI